MKAAEFKWGDLSQRQAKILTWWHEDSPYKDYDGIIADGAIRSGKTTAMAFSFVLWAMKTFSGENFAICGKTVGSARRNVINILKRQLKGRFAVKDKRSDNLLIISDGERTNLFYIFGGKDESSQDLIQGLTLAGIFFDEVALMPESFVNQATGRCSVEGSKWWFNCNPGSPQHWFYVKWVKGCKQRNIVYLHFTMADNLTLSERIKERYRKMYTGVFYQRYILGLWVMAQGLVYDMFSMFRHVVDLRQKDVALTIQTEGDWYVSCDFGIQNATVFLLWRKIKGTKKWLCLDEWYYSGRESGRQKTVAELEKGLESMLQRNGDIHPKQIIVDPSAAALIEELRRNGYHVRKAVNDVLDGVEDVQFLLAAEQLIFNNRCENTIREFGMYAWDEKASAKGEDVPIKDNDHCMDAVRYLVNTLNLVSKSQKKEYISIFTR